MSDAPTPPTAIQVVQVMVSATPYAQALGFEVTAVGDSRVTIRTPYRQDLIGDPATGVIAGGVITALLDHVCGASVMAAMKQRQSIATLDLRIDYLRAAEPGRDIFAEAHCYKVTRSVAFVRAVAFEDSHDNPVANATAAFMIASDGGRKPGANTRPPR